MEALDTYLRLLHPVMPFITERLWGALPHAAEDPELLIVASWPTARLAGERIWQQSDAAVGKSIDLITALRNARAGAGQPPSATLGTAVLLSDDAVATFEQLRPAIARLAHAELELLTSEEDFEAWGRPGDLSVVVQAGDLEARIRPLAADPAAAEADRARLEKELADAERLWEAAGARLANEAFTSKAPTAIVEGARAREAELAEQVARLRERLGR